jgi:hypothetical protein
MTRGAGVILIFYVLIELPKLGHIFRDGPVTEGQGYVLDASLAYHISPDNRTQVRLSWKDADGRSLGAEHPFRCPTGDSAGSRRIVLPLQAPDGSSYAALALSRFAPVRG